MKKKIKDYEDGDGEPGICPYCGNADLTYKREIKDTTGIIYPWTCNHCKRSGKETYEVTFSGHYHE